MNYGTKIDYYNSEQEDIYTIISNYFNDPVLTKVDNDTHYSTYVSQSKNALMSIYKRYIVVIVLKDNKQLGTNINLSELRWKSFQTRTFINNYNIKVSEFEHTPSNNPHHEIVLKDRNERYCMYSCLDLPIYITLLLEDWEDNQSCNRYQNKGTLTQALETWKTVISFV
jgi:hypothetical protein